MNSRQTIILAIASEDRPADTLKLAAENTDPAKLTAGNGVEKVHRVWFDATDNTMKADVEFTDDFVKLLSGRGPVV